MYRVFASCFLAAIFAISALHAAPTASKKSKDLAHLKSTPITYINSNGAEESDRSRHHVQQQHHHLRNKNEHNYPIKRYDNGIDDHHLAKYHSQHHHHHHQHNDADKMMHKSFDKKTKEFLSNAKLMNKLGLGKMRDSNHHKKRLAHESKYHGRPDDSHMFVIKLPPNPYYYTNNMPIPSQNAIMDNKKIPVGFNGKPGRIYHWNIPVMKKMLGNSLARNPNYRHADDINELLDIKNIPTWPKDSEVADKNAIKNELKNKLLKKKAASYYAPVKPKQINYFPGNGKPESLYVIEKSGKSLSPVPLIH